jgi:tetratricopeptide (TPR) repeat protein
MHKVSEIIYCGQKDYWNDGINAVAQKEYRLAKELLLKALNCKDSHIIYLHLTMSGLIKLYFEMRDKWDGAYDKCLFYCNEDLKVIFSDAFLKDEWHGAFLPRCISIQRLVIDFEKKGRFQEAISLCEKAISLGFRDCTKGGFQGRIDRLRKKIGTGVYI